MTNFAKIGKAICQNDQDIKNLFNINDLSKDQYDDYLRNLNNFLYAYLLIKYNKDLKYTYIDNNKKILSNNKNNNLALAIANSYKDGLFTRIDSNENEIIDQCIKIINDNFASKLTLASLACDIHVSKNYLCRLFKKKTGLSFCSYLNIQRVNHAKDLLDQDKTLDYISYECGFCSLSHFSTNFKRLTGLSPSAYKKQHTKQK
ncbi:MAG: AraC family transcriptional regulator [Peptoniphilaceae bacterium]|nr:AraC family transcriptional regulator [Peptoniphilaceae bacterium]MDY6018691.1 AraC family transcriptional regulator [Anaerococcus sp.]